MNIRNYHLFGAISLIMYIASFFFYAYYDEGIKNGIYGGVCFMNGLVFLLPVIIMDLYNLSMDYLWIIIWLANPLYWYAALYYYRHQYNRGGNYILAAIGLGLSFLLVKDVGYGNVTTNSYVIGEKLFGYYLWLASFLVLFIALFKHSLMQDDK